MSGHDDYSDDMGPVLLDDATTEALLRGETTTSDVDLAGVSAFLGEMRASASHTPPPPSPVLAALLRQGTRPQVLRDAAAAPGSARRGSLLRRWQGRVAVSALALSVGVTGIVGAGAAGLLPGPAERFVAGLVETLTPLHLPEDGGGVTDGRGGRQTTPAPGQGGSATTMSGGGAVGPDGGPATTAGPGAGPRPGVTAGGGAGSGGGAPHPGAPGSGPSSGPSPAGGPAPGITAPTVTTPGTPTTGRLPTAPTTTAPTVPSVTTPTIPRVSTTLPVTPPTTPRALP